MKTPVNSITIPPQYVAVASRWYAGINDLLYAVTSTKGLTTGTIRPRFGDDGRRASDEEWYWLLWSDLVDCIDSARDSAAALIERADYNGYEDVEVIEDLDVLDSFAKYAKGWADRLESEYSIQWDWTDHA